MIYVYMLFDNKINAPLYIGVTKNIEQRFVGHKNTTLKMYENISHVTIEILEETEIKHVSFLEQYWYYQMKCWGFNLIQSDCRIYKIPPPIQYSHIQLAHLSLAFNKSVQTIERWIRSNDDRLTSDKARAALLKIKK